MTTPTLPAAVRDVIDRIVHQYEDEPALDCVEALCAALGPLWADAKKDSERLDWPDQSRPPKVMSKLNPDVPRRAMIPEWCDAEKAIQDAVQKVEAMGASLSLTHAVTLLGDARKAVADHYDHTIRQTKDSK